VANIFLSPPDLTGRERELVLAAIDSNYVAPVGQMLDKFEKDICQYTGFSHSVGLSSGTAALHLALRLAGVGSGDEVWTTSMTFIGGVSPITFLGAKPVFFDISSEHWTLDPNLLEEQLIIANKNSRLPKVILPTDLYGQSCDLDAISTLCDKYGVKLITDSAEALGAFYKGQHAGTGSFCAILSFNGNKIITTSGGGMLLSNDSNVIKQAKYLSTQARLDKPYYEHSEIGYNYRLSNISAAIGVGQLEQIESKVDKRRTIFDRYVKHLGSYEGINFMPEPNGYRSTRWLTCLTLDESLGVSWSDVKKTCDLQGIEVRPLWKPMHMQPVFKDQKMIGGEVCEGLFKRGLCLPSGSGMNRQDQIRVIEVIRSTLP